MRAGGGAAAGLGAGWLTLLSVHTCSIVRVPGYWCMPGANACLSFLERVLGFRQKSGLKKKKPNFLGPLARPKVALGVSPRQVFRQGFPNWWDRHGRAVAPCPLDLLTTLLTLAPLLLPLNSAHLLGFPHPRPNHTAIRDSVSISAQRDLKGSSSANH